MTVKITMSRVLLVRQQQCSGGPRAIYDVECAAVWLQYGAPAEQQREAPQQHPEGTESKQSTVGAVQCPVLASAGWW